MIQPWADAPLKDQNKDLLEREPFVSMVSSLLINLADSNDSTVVGLVGPWGSGKSSILNFIKRDIRKKVKVVHFSPWSADSAEEIQQDFYAALLDAFPEGQHSGIRKKATTLLRRGSGLFKAIPVAGTAIAETVREFLPEESWHSAFKSLYRAIKASGVRVVVFVDDVDRLQPNELLAMLRTVRLAGRFPRVNYLLAYDQESLIATLHAGLGGSTQDAIRYLEKVVQYPLHMPPAQLVHLQNLVFHELGPVLKRETGGLWNSSIQRFESFYGAHMWGALSTPRACHRFTTQTKTYLALAQGDVNVQGEVDVADFAALTFVRLHHPAIYSRLREWRNHLVGSGQGAPIQEREDNKSAWVERIKNCGYSVEADIDEALRILAALFPRVGGELGWSPNSDGRCRLHMDAYFDRYINFSLPVGDVSDRLVSEQIDGLASGTLPNRPLLDTFDHPDAEVRMRAIHKGDQYSDWHTTKPSVHLVKFVAGSLARDPVQFDVPISPGMQKVGWLARLLDANLDMHPEDVAFMIGLFAAPASLGTALKRAMAVYYPHGMYMSADGSVESVEGESHEAPPEFLARLTEAWQHRAAEWIAETLTTETYSRSDREFLEVWSYMEFFDGLGFIRAWVQQKIQSQTFDLVTVAGHFAYRGTWQNDHFYFGDNGDNVDNIDIKKLKEIVPLEVLRSAPLSADIIDVTSPESGIAQLRRGRAVAGLRKYREGLDQTSPDDSVPDAQ